MKEASITSRGTTAHARTRHVATGESRHMGWSSTANGASEVFSFGVTDRKTGDSFRVELSKELAEDFARFVLWGKDRANLRQQHYSGAVSADAP